MDEREVKIIDAAYSVISRYGVKRTTMNDIAAEAGIARQSLYNVFASKEDVFRGAMRLYAERNLETIRERGAKAKDLGALLDIVFDQLALQPFDKIRAMPDADDLISGFGAAARDDIDKATKAYVAALADLLEPQAKAFRTAGLNPQALAGLVVHSAIAFKHKARSRGQLAGQLATLKRLVLHAAGAG